jgi:hypothetical protein
MFHGKAFLAKWGLLWVIVAAAGCPWWGPLLSVSPAAFTFDAAKTGSELTLANAGGGTLAWQIQSKPDWLAVTPSSGRITSESRIVHLEAGLSGLAPGNHTGTLAIKSNGGTRGIAVTAVVAPAPILEITPATLDFGGSATTRTFTITNAGAGALTWSILPPLSNWLSVSPSSGSTSSGAVATVTVTLDRTGLAPGTQVGPILIHLGSNAGAQVITVQAVVQAFMAIPPTLDFGAQLEQLPVTIRNNGADEVHWTINGAQLPAWLTLAPPDVSGTLAPQSEQTIQVRVNRTGLPSGVTSGPIRFASDGGEETVQVTVQGETPVLFVAPTALNFGNNKTSNTLAIQNTGTGTLAWTIEEGLYSAGSWTPQDFPWLTVTGGAAGLVMAGEVATVAVQVDRSQVTPDTDTPYHADLRIASVDGQQLIASVTMVALPPTLRVLPLNLLFGTTYVKKNLAIWNGGLGTVNWRVDTTGRPSWVSLAPVDASGIASGSVSGDQTASPVVSVDRAGLAPADHDYTWSFQVTAGDGSGSPLPPQTVAVSMNIARAPAIGVDTGNVDDMGAAFIPFGASSNSQTFLITNQGTGPLAWGIDQTRLPAWLKSVDPAQGSLDPLQQVTVTVKVDRTGLAYGDESHAIEIASNDPIRGKVPVRVEILIPKRVVIGVRPAEIALGLYGISGSFEIANTGDPGSMLNYQIVSNKPWLYLHPETGASEGTSDVIKNWQSVDVSVNRAQLDSTGATGTLTITAFEVEENGRRQVLPDVQPATVTVSVQAAPLSFEGAGARTRLPSLVRFVLLMRDIAYQPIPLARTVLDQFVDSFSIFEKDVPIERAETSQFLTSGATLRTSVVLLLDYSGSMYAAAQSVTDTSVSQAPDPLQALYEKCIPNLINELPDHYSIALMEFHERSQPSRVVFGADSEPIFTTNKAVVVDRLRNVRVTDHGATELLPAAIDAADELDAKDGLLMRIPFDDTDVRALICVTDGRLTTPPGRIKDTLDYLAQIRVRFFPVGWGQNVFSEPLARIGAGTGGHYYPTAMEDSGRTDARGNPIRAPKVSELLNWCTTEDSATAPCDQSIAKDLKSQVVLGYVTLTEDSPVTVRVAAKFDNPNDDDGVCLAEQGLISGSFIQEQLDFLAIAGDVELGQVSLHSDGIQGDHARVVVRAEYVPRNITAFTFHISSAQDFTIAAVQPDAGGIVSDWTVSATGSTNDKTCAIASPNDAPLPYGAFGDLLYLDFPALAPGTTSLDVHFEVQEPARATGDKYFIAADTFHVEQAGALAPAFPTPQITVTSPASEVRILDFGDTGTVARFQIRNIGGSDVQGGIWLNWKIGDKPAFLTVMPDHGSLKSNTAVDTITVILDRSIASGAAGGFIPVQFDAGALGTEPMVYNLVFLATIQAPALVVSSANFVPGTSMLDFGDTGTTLDISIANTGQSTLNWSAAGAQLPPWLSLTPQSGAVPLGTSTTVSVAVSRAGLASGSYENTFTILSDGGSTAVTAKMTVP